MAPGLSLRSTLSEAFRFAAAAWRRAPVACGLMTAAMLLPILAGAVVLSAWAVLTLTAVQAALIFIGWTGLLRAGQGLAERAPVKDVVRLLGSSLLNSLFLALILIVVGIVLLGVAGATGLAQGDDLTMAAQASITDGGWKTFVLLTLEIAALLLVLTLSARLMAAGPATIAEQRVVSLGALGATRGSGLKPAAGLIAALTPLILLGLSALVTPAGVPWIDWVWAGVLGFVQAPLLAGFATGLWRATQVQGVPQ